MAGFKARGKLSVYNVFPYDLTLSHNTFATKYRRLTDNDRRTDHRWKPYHKLDHYFSTVG